MRLRELNLCRIAMVVDLLFLPHQVSFPCSSFPLAFNFSNILLLTTAIIFLRFYILLFPKGLQIVTADYFFFLNRTHPVVLYKYSTVIIRPYCHVLTYLLCSLTDN